MVNGKPVAMGEYLGREWSEAIVRFSYIPFFQSTNIALTEIIGPDQHNRTTNILPNAATSLAENRRRQTQILTNQSV